MPPGEYNIKTIAIPLNMHHDGEKLGQDRGEDPDHRHQNLNDCSYSHVIKIRL